MAKRAGGQGIRVSVSHEAWSQAFDQVLGDSFSWEEEEMAARSVVERFYSTREVASIHTAFVRKVIDNSEGVDSLEMQAH